MKLKLGVREIDMDRIARMNKKGYNIAIITLTNGDEVKVVCNYSAENSLICSYAGTYEEFKSFVERFVDLTG